MSMASVLGDIEAAWGYTKICLKSCMYTVCTASICDVESPELTNSRSAICLETKRARRLISKELVGYGERTHPDISGLSELLHISNKPRPLIRDENRFANVTDEYSISLIEGGISAGSAALTLAANCNATCDSCVPSHRPKNSVATGRVQRFDISAAAVRASSHLSDVEYLCYMILLQLMSLRILSVWVVMSRSFYFSKALASVQLLGIHRSIGSNICNYKNLDPYSKSILNTAIELENLGRKLLDSPYDATYPADDELFPTSSEICNFCCQSCTGNHTHSSAPENVLPEEEVSEEAVEKIPKAEEEWLGIGNSAVKLTPTEHLWPLSDTESNENYQKILDQKDDIVLKEEHEVGGEQDTPTDSSSLLRASSETNTTALKVSKSHDEERRESAINGSPGSSEEEAISFCPPRTERNFQKKHTKSKASGFLISSLLKENSPKREYKRREKITKQQIHTSQVIFKARDTRIHTQKIHTPKKKSLSKNRKRKRNKQARTKPVSKSWQKSNTRDQCACSSNNPKVPSTDSEDEKILVVNYRKNGSRLVTFSDKNGFQKHLSLFISSEVEDHGLDFDKQVKQTVTGSTSSQDLPYKELCINKDFQEERELRSESESEKNILVSNRILSRTPSHEHKNIDIGKQEAAWEPSDVHIESELADTPNVSSEQVKDSSFVERIDQCTKQKESIPNVPLLEDNDNFAPRESQDQLEIKEESQHQEKLADMKAKEIRQSYRTNESKIGSSLAPKTVRAYTLRPETPMTSYPLKSILTDPAKRSPESKLLRQRVSFDFSQPDPLGSEANSYPVLPIYSPSEVSTKNAESRLRNLFQTDENCGMNDVNSEYIRLGAGTQVRDLIGDSQRVFEYPGSSYLAPYW